MQERMYLHPHSDRRGRVRVYLADGDRGTCTLDGSLLAAGRTQPRLRSF
jgi:hypothetical protein